MDDLRTRLQRFVDERRERLRSAVDCCDEHAAAHSSERELLDDLRELLDEEPAPERYVLWRMSVTTDARPEGSMDGRDGSVTEGFEVPEGGRVVGVEWIPFGDALITFLLPDTAEEARWPRN